MRYIWYIYTKKNKKEIPEKNSEKYNSAADEEDVASHPTFILLSGSFPDKILLITYFEER